MLIAAITQQPLFELVDDKQEFAGWLEQPVVADLSEDIGCGRLAGGVVTADAEMQLQLFTEPGSCVFEW